MNIQVGLTGCVKVGVGCVAAQAYGACMCQAVVFSSTDMLVSKILTCLIRSYLQDTRQISLADIAIKVVSGLAGVLTTRLFSEKTIDWKQAIASSAISSYANTWAFNFFFPKPKT